MKHRLHRAECSPSISWNRRPNFARTRRHRPGIDHLESRHLLSTVTEFALQSGTGAAPAGITAGPDGSLWFTESGASKIGVIDSSTGIPHEYTIPTSNSQPHGITIGPDGNVWFTEIGGNQIGVFNPTTHEFDKVTGLTDAATPFDITTGPNNTIWFTEKTANRIGSIDVASRKVTEYQIPTSNSVPQGITHDADGNIWFAESLGNKIAKFDTTNHTFVEHTVPTAGAQPYGVTIGPGGGIWFTEYTGNQIGVFNPSSSSFTEIKIPTAKTQPTEIVAAPNGTIWFTQSGTDQVAMYNPMLMNAASPKFTEIDTQTAGAGPRAIAVASDGSIWFTEVNSGKVATVVPNRHIVVPSSPPVDIRLGETFALTVEVEFESGAVDTHYAGSVSLALVGGSSAGLSGLTSVTAVNGVASFTGLSLLVPGTFSIQVTSGTATPATIGPISVSGPPGSAPVNPPGRVTSPPVLLGEKLVMAGKGANRYVAGIVLTFSSALDPTSAQNTANYAVTQIARNRRISAAKAIRVRAIYNSAHNTVRLKFVGKPRFASGGQLVVVGSRPTGISSAAGMHLEGNNGADGRYRIMPNGRGIA